MADTNREDHYTCNICTKVYPLHSMYACYHGHYLCRKCYRQVYYKGKAQATPQVTSEGEMVHEVESKEEQPIEKSRYMFPNPAIYSESAINETLSAISLSSFCKGSNLSLSTLSKKPINCPHFGCNKTIAVSALDVHFEHDHKHVTSIVTNLETRNSLEFSFRDLNKGNKSLCLILINVEECGDGTRIGLGQLQNDKNAPALTQKLSQGRLNSLSTPKPFFIVMAAKLTDPTYEEDEEEENMDAGFTQYDKAIFYVASNILTALSYTIAVSMPDQSVRMKYYGPLLNLSKNFKRLSDEGRGLILNHWHVNGMSDLGAKPVSLDVVIHETREGSYDSD